MMDGMGTEGRQRVIGQKFSSGGAILSGHVSRPQAPRNRNENRAGGSIATTCRRAGLLKITSDKRLYRKQWHVSASRKALIGHPARRGNLSNMAMASVLHRMDRKEITVHGFRSKFRDWAAERTNYPNHVVEMALRTSSETRSRLLIGAMAFITAARHKVDAAVAYHGSDTEKYLGEVGGRHAPLLMHLGEEDEFISKITQGEIKAALSRMPNAAVYSYPGQPHAFSRHNGLHYAFIRAIILNYDAPWYVDVGAIS